MAAITFGNTAQAPGGGFGSVGANPPLGGSSLGGFGSPPPAPGTQAPTIQVPPLQDSFPDKLILERVNEALKNPNELPNVLNETKDALLRLHESEGPPVAPNHSLRQQLSQNPVVSLDGNVQARLLPQMLQDVCGIADDLRVSEVTALALYQKASQFPAPFKSPLFDRLVGTSIDRQSTVGWMAREYYFDQRPSLLLACRAILHEQLRDDTAHRVNWIKDWVQPLLQLVRVTTRRVQELLAVSQQDQSLWRVTLPLALARWERLLAAECLFFIAYQEDIGDSSVAILNVLHELTNALRVLDPFRDVPDPHTASGTDKDEEVWRTEWLGSARQTGLPDLLRLCSVLTVTLLAAQQRGPLPASFSDRIQASESQWERPDFLGILSAAPGRSEWQRRLQWQPFTLARVSILPALFTTKNFDTPHLSPREFYISTLACWGVESLERAVGNTISKEKWDEEVREITRLQREQREQQRQLHGRYGSSVPPEAAVEVPGDRPDCLDDVAEFCTALCAVGPDFAAQFCTDNGSRLPHTVRELENQQKSDASLRPCFLSFLGSLASSAAEDIFDCCDWKVYLATIRVYASKLNPQGDRGTDSRISTAPASTEYYYFGGPAAGSSNTKKSDISASSPSGLGDADTASLLSHLYLISTVAKYSVRARASLISLEALVTNGRRETVDRDSLLDVLMTLSVQALSPVVRGAVFTAVANLLRTDDCQNTDQIPSLREASLRVWELLEGNQILPISQLEQYPSVHEINKAQVPGLAFPPSSTSMASRLVQRKAIPTSAPFQHQKFGLLFEMEYVEASLGYYPSTEGFLRLLGSLIAGGGCPPTLGQNWRVRPGCLPYVEYVIHYVLPRASGSFSAYNTPSLVFRSSDDRSRLECLALRVIEAALVRYNIPSPSILQSYSTKTNEIVKEMKKANEEALAAVLDYDDVKKCIYMSPHDPDEAKAACDDFIDTPVHVQSGDPTTLETQTSIASGEEVGRVQLPRSRVPGFAVLVELLSASSSQLFKSIVSVLTDHEEGILIDRTLEDLTVARALYLSTPPSFSTAKSGAIRHVSAFDRQNLMSKRSPPPMDFEKLEDDGVRWMTDATRSALFVLCAAVARESSFSQAMASSGKRLAYIPVLRFVRSMAVPLSGPLHLSPISSLLFNVSPGSLQSVWFSLMRQVGFVSYNPQVCLQISSVATSSLFYLFRSLGPHQTLQVLQASVRGSCGSKILMHSLAQQLEFYMAHLSSEGNCHFASFILESLLSELRKGQGTAIANTLFDASSPLFKAILVMLSREDFLIGQGKLACQCFEIVFRLTSLNNDLGNVVAVGKRSEYLRSTSFWIRSLSRILEVDPLTESPYLRHGLAWVLKSLAHQLHLLSGMAEGMSASPDIRVLLAPMPLLYQQYCGELLREDGVVFTALATGVPLAEHKVERSTIPIELADFPGAKDALSSSTRPASFVPEMSSTFQEIDEERLINKLVDSSIGFDEAKVKSWVRQWNRSIAEESASAHLSKAIVGVFGSFRECGNGAAGNTAFGAEFSHRIHHGITALLDKISQYQSSQPSNELRCYPVTARNLATCVVLAIDTLLRNYDVSTGLDDLTSMFTTASRSIVDTSQFHYVRWNERDTFVEMERVALLSTAQCLISLPLSEPMMGIDPSQFPEKSIFTLLAASSSTADKKSAVVRTFLCKLLDFDRFSLDEARNFCETALALEIWDPASKRSKVIRSLIGLLPSLDDTVAPLLAAFASVDGIAALMIDENIIEKLQDVADENQRKEFAQTNTTTFTEQAIATPPFLMGHLNLLEALLPCSIGASTQEENVASSILAVLKSYENVFERLCAQFPLDGDLLFTLVRCLVRMVQASSAMHLVAMTWSLHSNIAKRVVGLSFMLAENPLPTRFLCTVPPFVKDDSVLSPSWWLGISSLSDGDRQVSRLSSRGMINESTCETAILAMQFAKRGLMLGIKLDLLANIDHKLLCRCLFRISDAVVQLQNQINGLSGIKAIGDVNSAEGKLLPELNALLRQLLDLSVSVLRGAKELSRREAQKVFIGTLRNSRLNELVGQQNTSKSIDEYYDLLYDECEGDKKEKRSKFLLLN